MANTADVVIVGGGITGVCAAYSLTRAGVPKVLLLEKDSLAAGGTGKSAGIVRMHYDNRPEAELAWAAYPTFRHWDNLIGYGTCEFVQTGYLVIPNADESEKLAHNVAMLREIGIETSVVPRKAVQEMFPAIACDDMVHASWEPEAGYADPSSTVNGMAQAARALGAEFRQNVRVTRVNVRGDRVTGVSTSAGEFSSPVVLLATGGWTPSLAAGLGLDLPITSIRTQVFQVKRPPPFATPAPHPIVMDYAANLYYRPETGSLTVGGLTEHLSNPVDPDCYGERIDAEFIESIVRLLPHRLPFMEDAQFMGGWTGPLDFTPDGKPILGSAGPEGLFIAAGHSGHGFKIGPAVGACMAELITEGRARTVDIRPFRPSRWTEGQPLVGAFSYSVQIP